MCRQVSVAPGNNIGIEVGGKLSRAALFPVDDGNTVFIQIVQVVVQDKDLDGTVGSDRCHKAPFHADDDADGGRGVPPKLGVVLGAADVAGVSGHLVLIEEIDRACVVVGRLYDAAFLVKADALLERLALG